MFTVVTDCSSIKVQSYCEFFDNQCKWKDKIKDKDIECLDKDSKKPLALTCNIIKYVEPDFIDCRGKKDEDIINISCEIIPWEEVCNGLADCGWLTINDSSFCKTKENLTKTEVIKIKK